MQFPLQAGETAHRCRSARCLLRPAAAEWLLSVVRRAAWRTAGVSPRNQIEQEAYEVFHVFSTNTEVDRTSLTALDLQRDHFALRRNVAYDVKHKRPTLARLLLIGAQSGPRMSRMGQHRPWPPFDQHVCSTLIPDDFDAPRKSAEVRHYRTNCPVMLTL